MGNEDIPKIDPKEVTPEAVFWNRRNFIRAAAAFGSVAATALLYRGFKPASETGTASTQVLSSAQSLARDGNLLADEVNRFLATIRAA